MFIIASRTWLGRSVAKLLKVGRGVAAFEVGRLGDDFSLDRTNSQTEVAGGDGQRGPPQAFQKDCQRPVDLPGRVIARQALRS